MEKYEGKELMIIFATLFPTTFILAAGILILSKNWNSSEFRLLDQSLNQIEIVVARQKDRTKIKERLNELDSNVTYEKFRLTQFLISVAAGLLPISFTLIGTIKMVPSIGLAILNITFCYFYLDRNLSKQIENRRKLMESEFPAVVEILTLAIGAGDSPLSAFSRIAHRSESILAISMREVVSEVRKGVPFHKALDRFSQDSKSLIIRRFVDALVIAMMRGAPLVDVLHRHVSEARINHRNLILDKSGKAEITMMIPIVFLILPISVVFALWPSMANLSFFAT